MGALAGLCLRTNNSGNRKALWLVIAGIICITAGFVWGGAFIETKCKLVFPIVKVLCTSSFILYAGGWSLLLLALFYWVIDVKGYKKWAFFFVVIGMNPLLIYFLQQGMVDFTGIANYFVRGVLPHTGAIKPIVLPVCSLAVKWLFLWLLYSRRIFFKI